MRRRRGALHGSVWFPWIGARWNESACVYGPAAAPVDAPRERRRGQSVARAPGRPCGDLAHSAQRSSWSCRSAASEEEAALSYDGVVESPLCLLEGPGQLHTDLLGVVAVTRRGSVLPGTWAAEERGGLSYAIALLGKYTLRSHRRLVLARGGEDGARDGPSRVPARSPGSSPRSRSRCLRRSGAESATLTEPASGTLADMNPGGTLTEFAGHLVHLARGGTMAAPDRCAGGAGTRPRPRDPRPDLGRRILHPGARDAFWIGVRVLRAMLQRPADDETIALGTGILIVLVVTLASRRFEPWYLMAALPFFRAPVHRGLAGAGGWRPWRRRSPRRS